MFKKNSTFSNFKKSTIATLVLGAFISSAYAETYKLRIGAGHPVQGIAHVTAVQDFFMPEVNKRLEKLGHKVEWTAAWGVYMAKSAACLAFCRWPTWPSRGRNSLCPQATKKKRPSF